MMTDGHTELSHECKWKDDAGAYDDDQIISLQEPLSDRQDRQETGNLSIDTNYSNTGHASLHNIYKVRMYIDINGSQKPDAFQAPDPHPVFSCWPRKA